MATDVLPEHSAATVVEATAPGGLARRALRVPLPVKLAGLHVLAALAAVIAGVALRDAWVTGRSILVPAFVLLLAMVGSALLAHVALSPVRAIARTAERVRRGDLNARVPASALAGPDVLQVAATINTLLDGVSADRERMRQLASMVIDAADRERAAIARELHDSSAQSMAAVVMQLSVLEQQAEGDISARIAGLRRVAQEAMEEVRRLAHTLHPRVLDDLGLAAALQNLCRRVQEATDARIQATILGGEGIATPVASVLYRVAQESLHNAVRHAGARAIRLELTRGARAARVEIQDDGRGFDVREAERRRPGMGLFTMRERVLLVGGSLQVISKPAGGTRVIATVPLQPEEGADAR